MKKIILIEFIDEAKIFLKNYGKEFLNSKDVYVIALHPKVRSFLKEADVATRGTLNYLDNNAQHRIILKTEELKNQLIQRLHLEDGFGIKKSYEEVCIHHLRFYLNHFLWIIEILDSIKEKHPVSEIYCCLPKNKKKMYTKEAYIQNEERFLGLLAEDFCKANKLIFMGVPLTIKKSNFFISLAERIVRTMAILVTSIDYWFSIAKKPGDKKTIVIPAISYHMDSLLKGIRKRHPDSRSIMIWEGKSTFKQELFKIYFTLSNLLKKLKNKNVLDGIIHLDLISVFLKKDVKQQHNIEEEFEKLNSAIRLEMKDSLAHKGISFCSYLGEKVSYGLKHEILTMQHLTMVLNNILKKLQPKFLMAMYSLGIYHTMGELSRVLDFCSLNISHGTHVTPENEFEKIENYELAKSVILNTYKYVAVQTPWADKFLNYYNDKRPRVFSGPLLYSSKDNGMRERRMAILGKYYNGKIIIHATTQKPRHGMRFHIDETLDEYISTLIDLVNAVDDLDDVFLVIRPHPVCDISEKEFRLLLPRSNRFIVMNNGPFGNVLSIADILISYSSTCIEEALQSNIPVVLFDKWRRYNHFNIEETKDVDTIEKRPVFYFTDAEIFRMGIRKILDLFENNPLSENELKNYKYPTEYRLNFFNFVDRALKEEVKF